MWWFKNLTLSAAGLWLVCMMWVGIGIGRPLYLEDLPPRQKKCLVCHTTRSGPSLNAFGQDYYNAGLEIPLDVDSDHDGYTNAQEIAAGTSPGDPNDYPGHRRLHWEWVVGAGILALAIWIGIWKLWSPKANPS